jgi:phage shock protein PspC (stress-responsive transcriptional regulator)
VVTRTRLRRRTENRLVAGVAGGIADRLNASVGFMRAFLGLASLWTFPWVVGGYALAALLIPARGADRPGWDNIIGFTRLAVLFGVPTLAFGDGLVVNERSHGSPGWWIAYVGLMVAGAAALLSADYRRERPRTREERRAVVLGAVPVILAFLLVAAGMLLAPDVRWERVVPLAALVGAVALLLAAGRRSPAGFLAPAVLGIAVAGLVVASDARLQGGLGDIRVTPAPSGGVLVERRAIGDLTVDLRRAVRTGRETVLDASVGIGTLEVVVPARTRVVLEAEAGQGRVEAFLIAGVDGLQGFDVHRSASGKPPRRRHGLATLRVKARVGLGEVTFTNGPNANSLVEAGL